MINYKMFDTNAFEDKRNEFIQHLEAFKRAKKTVKTYKNSLNKLKDFLVSRDKDILCFTDKKEVDNYLLFLSNKIKSKSEYGLSSSQSTHYKIFREFLKYSKINITQDTPFYLPKKNREIDFVKFFDAFTHSYMSIHKPIDLRLYLFKCIEFDTANRSGSILKSKIGDLKYDKDGNIFIKTIVEKKRRNIVYAYSKISTVTRNILVVYLISQSKRKNSLIPRKVKNKDNEEKVKNKDNEEYLHKIITNYPDYYIFMSQPSINKPLNINSLYYSTILYNNYFKISGFNEIPRHTVVNFARKKLDFNTDDIRGVTKHTGRDTLTTEYLEDEGFSLKGKYGFLDLFLIFGKYNYNKKLSDSFVFKEIDNSDDITKNFNKSENKEDNDLLKSLFQN